MSGPGELNFTAIAAASIIGENKTMQSSDPTISIARFINAFPASISGTWRIWISGRPRKSTVYGFVEIISL